MRAGADYDATLTARGRTRRLVLRRVLSLPGMAMTVLDCARCGHRVYAEAHHRYGSGRPRARRPGYQPRAWDKRCPKCGSATWRYVRTEVADLGPRAYVYVAVPGAHWGVRGGQR